MKMLRIFDILDHLKEYGNKDILARREADGKWKKYTIDEYVEHAYAISSALLELGVKKGDKVATIRQSPLVRISPSSANLNSMQSSTGPTVPGCSSFLAGLLTEITGDVSVSPYPSNTYILAAVNVRMMRSWMEEPPDTIIIGLPPICSRHFE